MQNTEQITSTFGKVRESRGVREGKDIGLGDMLSILDFLLRALENSDDFLCRVTNNDLSSRKKIFEHNTYFLKNT